MILHGTVLDHKLAATKNGQSQKKAVHLKVKFSGNDVRWVQYAPGSGIDAIPPNGAVCVCSLSGVTLKFVTAIWDQIESTVDAGEVKIYSSDGNGTIKGKTTYKKNGSVKTENDQGSIELANDGKTVVKNQSGSLASILCDLIDDVSGMKTMGPPPQHVVSPDDIAKFTALKTRLQQVLKD